MCTLKTLVTFTRVLVHYLQTDPRTTRLYPLAPSPLAYHIHQLTLTDFVQIIL